jgi:hypothetical protein
MPAMLAVARLSPAWRVRAPKRCRLSKSEPSGCLTAGGNVELQKKSATPRNVLLMNSASRAPNAEQRKLTRPIDDDF